MRSEEVKVLLGLLAESLNISPEAHKKLQENQVLARDFFLKVRSTFNEVALDIPAFPVVVEVLIDIPRRYDFDFDFHIFSNRFLLEKNEGSKHHSDQQRRERVKLFKESTSVHDVEKLIPGCRYKLTLYSLGEDAARRFSSKEIISFLEEKNAHLVGVQGLALIRPLIPVKVLTKEMPVVSFGKVSSKAVPWMVYGPKQVKDPCFGANTLDLSYPEGVDIDPRTREDIPSRFWTNSFFLLCVTDPF